MIKNIRVAVVSEKGGAFNVENAVLDDIRESELLINIKGVGICHTDLMCRDQHLPVALPHVLGHEGSGVVEAVGSMVTDIEVGDHVVLSFNACGDCAKCKSGSPNYCLNSIAYNLSGGRIDGSHTLSSSDHNHLHGNFFGQSSFGSYAIAHQNNVVKVSKEIPVEILGCLGCSVQTGAGAVFNSLNAEAGSSIAIFGMGAVGLSAVMAAKIRGCETIFASDINPAKLKIATDLGATHVVNPEKDNLVEIIHECSRGGVNYSLDCVGIPEVFRQAFDSLNTFGELALVGVPPQGAEISVDMSSILFGKKIKGVLGGDGNPHTMIPELIDHYRNGSFPFDRLITQYPFENIEKAVEDMEKGRVIKPVLIL